MNPSELQPNERSLGRRNIELTTNCFRERSQNFAMTWNWNSVTVDRILVYRMALAFSNKQATMNHQMANEISPFHVGPTIAS